MKKTYYYVWDGDYFRCPWSAPYNSVMQAYQYLYLKVKEKVWWRNYCSPQHPVKEGDVIGVNACVVKVDGEVQYDKFIPQTFEVISVQEEINRMVDKAVRELAEEKNERDRRRKTV